MIKIFFYEKTENYLYIFKKDSLMGKIINISIIFLVFLSLSLSSYAQSKPAFEYDTSGTLTNNLVSYWKLDEPLGPRTDSVGGNNLKDSADVSVYTGGKKYASAQFNGNGYLSIPDNPSLNTGNSDFTIAAWVRLNSKGQYDTLLGKDDVAKNREYMLMRDSETDRWSFWIDAANLKWIKASSPVIATNTWYFIVAWHDSSADTINIQVDNSPVNSLPTGGVFPPDGTANFEIGGRSGGAYPFNGAIDEIGFWKRTLTEQERSDLYNSGKGNTMIVVKKCIPPPCAYPPPGCYSIPQNDSNGCPTCGKLVCNLPPGTIPISSCQEITKSGNYVLTNDIKSMAGNSCINIHDADKINLNCNNHEIVAEVTDSSIDKSAILISNSKNFFIGNCKLQTKSNTVTVPYKTSYFSPLQITDSSQGVVDNNTIGSAAVIVRQSNDVKFLHNKFASYFQAHSSHYITLDGNTFRPDHIILEKGSSDNVGFDGGSDNKILNNIIDGAWDGSIAGNHFGADDNIVLRDEDTDVVQNNTLVNAWDCGFENAGFLYNSKIVGNTIKNQGYCGIGGWYHNSWKNNLVDANKVAHAPTLFQIYRSYGMRAQDQYIYFKDNVFSNNIFSDPSSPDYSASASINFNYLHFYTTLQSNDVRLATQQDLVLGNNRFVNNDFGTASFAPSIQPGSLAVDGGGNICRSSLYSDFPLTCKDNVTGRTVKLGENFDLKINDLVQVSDYKNLQVKLIGITCASLPCFDGAIFTVEVFPPVCNGEICTRLVSQTLSFSKTNIPQNAFGAAITMLSSSGSYAVFIVNLPNECNKEKCKPYICCDNSKRPCIQGFPSFCSGCTTDICNPTCGNGICEERENYQNCPKDCTVITKKIIYKQDVIDWINTNCVDSTTESKKSPTSAVTGKIISKIFTNKEYWKD